MIDINSSRWIQEAPIDEKRICSIWSKGNFSIVVCLYFLLATTLTFAVFVVNDQKKAFISSSLCSTFLMILSFILILLSLSDLLEYENTRNVANWSMFQFISLYHRLCHLLTDASIFQALRHLQKSKKDHVKRGKLLTFFQYLQAPNFYACGEFFYL